MTNKYKYGHGYRYGYGYGHGAGYGYGEGSGSGEGHGNGEGYGSGDEDGSGYGDGYGAGDGEGKIIGTIDGLPVEHLSPFPYLKIGCQYGSIEWWEKNWLEQARVNNSDVTREDLDKLLSKVNK